MEEEIKKIREKLNRSIETEEKYDIIYKISVELDELISKYYMAKQKI